jgi:hypothetical protein
MGNPGRRGSRLISELSEGTYRSPAGGLAHLSYHCATLLCLISCRRCILRLARCGLAYARLSRSGNSYPLCLATIGIWVLNLSTLDSHLDYSAVTEAGHWLLLLRLDRSVSDPGVRQEAAMPFVNCECSSRSVLLDRYHPFVPLCPHCGQPMKPVQRVDWSRIAEQRRQQLAVIVKKAGSWFRQASS